MDLAEKAFREQEAFKAKSRNAPMFKLLRAQGQSTVESDPPGRKVLVIEDNQDSAESLRMILDMLGYDVSVAHTGSEGIDQARRLTPYAIICDIGLPGQDGYSVVRTLRREPATVATPIIALTAYGSNDDRARAMECGFNHYLVKPTDPVVLLRLLADPENAEAPE